MAASPAILIVDDDAATRILLQAFFEGEGYSLEFVNSAEDALSLLQTRFFDLVITDVVMPGMDGITLMERIHQLHTSTKVVVMTAASTPQTVIRAIQNRAYTYLGKPVSRASLLEAVQSALSGSDCPDDIELVSAQPHWVALRVRCKLVLADRLAQFFRELATDLAPAERDSISSAFRELLMNAIEHGGKNDPSRQVYLSYIRTTRSIIYYIRDPGEGFSMDKLPHAAVSNSPDSPFGHAEIRDQMGIRPGGFGILLSRNFADELVYSEKGNEVVLVKYLS